MCRKSDCHHDQDTDSPGLAARGGMACVRFYRRYLSAPLHFLAGPGAGCRFEPSCSAYGLEALRRHGFFKGSALAFWRILRCGPWSRGGADPVPPKK